MCVERKSIKPPDVVLYETTYVRGGRGNPRLISFQHGYSKGSIEEKQSHAPERVQQINLNKEVNQIQLIKPLFDYFDESTHPKEWSNIEIGSDIFKLTGNEKRRIIRFAAITLITVALIIAYIMF